MWWALYSEPGRTLIAVDELRARSVDVVCPVERLTRRRKLPNRNVYKVEQVTSPVFGSYVFADAEAPAAVTNVRGVGGCVTNGLGALSVLPRVIETLRSLCTFTDGIGDLMGKRDTTMLIQGQRAKVGGRVRVTDGPFIGFEGVIRSLSRLSSDGVVITAVEMFGKKHDLDMPVGQLKVLPKAA